MKKYVQISRNDKDVFAWLAQDTILRYQEIFVLKDFFQILANIWQGV